MVVTLAVGQSDGRTWSCDYSNRRYKTWTKRNIMPPVCNCSINFAANVVGEIAGEIKWIIQMKHKWIDGFRNLIVTGKKLGYYTNHNSDLRQQHLFQVSNNCMLSIFSRTNWICCNDYCQCLPPITNTYRHTLQMVSCLILNRNHEACDAAVIGEACIKNYY